MRQALPYIGVAVRLLAAGIWLFAGVSKVFDLASFHDKVDKYQLLPHMLEAPFAYTLPFVEILVGIYLAVGLLTRVAAAAGCVLMVLFLIALTQAWARGLVLDCGCFGSIVQEKVGPVAILRDMALGLPTLAMLIWPARRFSLDSRLLGKPDVFARFPRLRAA